MTKQAELKIFESFEKFMIMKKKHFFCFDYMKTLCGIFFKQQKTTVTAVVQH